ncbi:MAG: hypothetical protein EBU90_06685 [Proteobacteria bacterium]|nr:hypothetical protein [Pseudomonadota bacterium]NBP14994.1 hypothetical protein [bacterium]
MQYPPGTSFQVSKLRLSRSGLLNRNILSDGLYTILSIFKLNETISYRLKKNISEVVCISGMSCTDFDRYIAYCRNEQFREPVSEIDLEDGLN